MAFTNASRKILSGLLVTSMAVALLSCTTLSRRQNISLEQIQNGIAKKDCPQLKIWAEDKATHPHDFLQLQYAVICDAKFELTLKNPSWYAPLLNQVKNQRSLATPEIEDDLEVWFEQARLSKIKRDKEAHYLKIIASAPNSVPAQKAQESLWKLSPRLSPNASQLDPLLIAKDYREAIENKKALDIINQVLAKAETSDQKLPALEEKRQILRSLQDKKAQLLVTKEIYNLRSLEFQQKVTAANNFLSAALLYGRAVWTENNPADAREIFKDAADKLKGKSNLGELYWVLGKLEDEQKNSPSAISYFEKSLAEPPSSFTLRALWSAGWSHYKEKDYQRARDLFLELAAKDPTETRARFWAARSLTNLKQKELAQQEFDSLKLADPLGYYGLMAQREVKTAFTPIKSNSQTQLSVDSQLSEKLGKWNWLELTSLLQIADSDTSAFALESVANSTKDLTAEEAYEFSKLYAVGKLYLPLFSQIQKLPAALKNDLLKVHPELLFPVDYQDEIQKWSLKQQVPAEFIFSIIRQESTFNPLARSPVDALGLMQMMPSLAAKKAKELSLPYKDAHDLFDPSINIALGTSELSELLKQYKGSYILASAGYNASHKAIKGWLGQRYRADSLEFIEEVGYDETRSYIKLVLRNFLFYKRLLAQNEFLFPEELLLLPEK